MTSPAADVLAESTASAGRLLRAARRKLPEIVLGLGVLLSVLAVLALAGAFLDDLRIDSHRATASATVLDGSTYWRTIVQFTDVKGQLDTPAVYYPSGLEPGQNIYVEYDTTMPNRVRVAGRSAVDGLLPMLGGVVVLWLLLGPLVVWLRRRRAGRADPGPAQPRQSR